MNRSTLFRTAAATIILIAAPAFAEDQTPAPSPAPAAETPPPAPAAKTITMEQAIGAVQASLKEAKKDGSDVSVVIIDADGQILLQARGNLASPHNLDLARRKALTAETFKMPSLAWEKKTLAADPDHERDMPDVIPLGGGVPVMDGDMVIAAVGASGTKGGQEGDQAAARAGADFLSGIKPAADKADK